MEQNYEYFNLQIKEFVLNLLNNLIPNNNNKMHNLEFCGIVKLKMYKSVHKLL